MGEYLQLLDDVLVIPRVGGGHGSGGARRGPVAGVAAGQRVEGGGGEHGADLGFQVQGERDGPALCCGGENQVCVCVCGPDGTPQRATCGPRALAWPPLVCGTRPTCHGEGLDAGLHLNPVLLLQPRAVQEPDGGLQQLGGDGVVRLWGGTDGESGDLVAENIDAAVVLTCREVLFSENGELKKALMVSKTTLMMYFSRMGSVRRFSRLLQTCPVGGRR